MPTPSKRAVDFIIAFEVTSQATYEKKYRRPEWPGGASGITIGVGYDLGYVTIAEMEAAWKPHRPAEMITAMRSVTGKKGLVAKALLAGIRPKVDVPWDTAYAVFQDNTLPKYQAMTDKALPNTALLSGDSYGALVSLTFNRGASYGKTKDVNDPMDRYREMRAIKKLMASQAFASIPAEITAMQRLWPNVAGLQRRRREEAKLFKDGLF
jgi:hypothetical protein